MMRWDAVGVCLEWTRPLAAELFDNAMNSVGAVAEIEETIARSAAFGIELLQEAYRVSGTLGVGKLRLMVEDP